MNDELENVEVFLPLGDNKHYRLNPEAVRDEDSYRKALPYLRDESTRNDNNPSHNLLVRPAKFFADKCKRARETKGAVVVGVLLSYSSPNQYKCMPRDTRNVGSTLGKVGAAAGSKQPQPANFNKMGMFGDCSPRSSSTFCLFFRNKHSLYDMCENNLMANTITLGDLVAIVRPMLDEGVLQGSDTPILKDPWRILVLKKRLLYPPRIIKMAESENDTHHFHQNNVQVELSNPRFLTGSKLVPCFATTCDRQDINCKGCLGAHGHSFRKNVVLCVTVEVLDQPQHNEKSGVATFEFRSFQFMKQVIRGYEGMLDAEFGEIKEKQRKLEVALEEHADWVNNHGGWTVDGWHRRGTRSDKSGETYWSVDAPGHLIKLHPTNIMDDDREAHENTLFNYDE